MKINFFTAAPVNCLALDKTPEYISEEKNPTNDPEAQMTPQPSSKIPDPECQEIPQPKLSEYQESAPQPSSKATTPSKAKSTKKVLLLLNDLQTCIIKGGEANVIGIVKQFPALVNTHFETGWLPLHYAARFVLFKTVNIIHNLFLKFNVD